MRRHRIIFEGSFLPCLSHILAACVGACILVLFFAQSLPAASAKSTYLKADACYRKLLKQPDRMKYRHNWMTCGDQFQAAYRVDPAGPWAAASLYMNAQLYDRLYRLSYKASDKQEAVDLYERIVKRYPKSRYREKAAKELNTVNRSPAATRAAASAAPPSDPQAESAYRAAESCANDLALDPKKRKYRHNWLKCIGKYQTAYQKDPGGPRAAASLYQSGSLYLQLHRYSQRTSDRDQAFEFFRQVASRFAASPYAARAQLTLGHGRGPEPDKPAPAPSAPANSSMGEDPGREPPPGNGPGLVTGLRYWSNPRYTRIVVDATRETGFAHRLLKKDPSIGKPQRLYVDFENSRLKSGVQREVPINDNLLLDARAGQYTADSVRVVVDIKSFDNYKVFSLSNPFRVVIDVWGKLDSPPVDPSPGAPPVPLPSKNGDLPPSALAKQLALGVRRIIIDPGHGGKDFGAPGYSKGVHEKNVVLQLAKRLARKIEKELGYEAILTRSSDRYLTLEERTAIANTKNADLFISIHTNAARKRHAYGIETFFLNLATDDDAILVAARENATSTKNISDLQTILSDLMQNAKINESSRLASNVQTALYQYLKPRYSHIKSKGVKQAPFYVLLGAEMPAILIETSFISNARECQRLTDPAYQDHLCDGIIKGIRGYIREINPAAYVEGSQAIGARG